MSMEPKGNDMADELVGRMRKSAQELREFHTTYINLLKGTDHPEMIFWPAAEYLDEAARRLSRPSTAEAVADALQDSAYLAGAKAGWNAAQDDDPNAAFEQIVKSREGYLKPIKDAQAARGDPSLQGGVEPDGEAGEEELCKLVVRIWGFKWVEFADIPPPGVEGRDRIGEAYAHRLNAQDAVRGILRRFAVIKRPVTHPIGETDGPEPVAWRCFHCDEVFTTRETAHQHFGSDELHDPACCIDIAKLRDMERELDRYRAEDSDKDREFHAMRSDHVQALIREEEKGYEKGLADGRALFTHPVPDGPLETRNHLAEHPDDVGRVYPLPDGPADAVSEAEVDAAAQAMLVSFQERISTMAGLPYAETKVTTPNIEVYRAYAVAALEAAQRARK